MSVEVIRAANLSVPHGFLGRRGGVSTGELAGLNVGYGSGDERDSIAENRARAIAAVLPGAELATVHQIHSANVVRVERSWAHEDRPHADSMVTDRPGLLLGILTADCAPVLLADAEAGVVGAAHAGWRGLASGVVESALRAMAVAPDRMLAWLGPAIEQDMFEVGPEVREQFVARSADNADAFKPTARGRWQADLYDLARRELARLGVTQVFGGGFRCHADRDRFYSYRRDGKTGRMATLVWMK